MITFPNCKINLGLNITGKRNDGYHDLETVFYPIPLKDAIEVIKQEKDQLTPHEHGDNVQYSISGLSIAGHVDDNLCVKAYNLVRKDFPGLPAVKMHLHKTIPMGAGLGGGSADGAFTLKLLNKKFKLGLTENQLVSYALRLGSDCPFFIINKPVYATGRGEKMETINIDLSGYNLVLVHPGIHISTGLAFSSIKAFKPAKTVKDIVQEPIASWKHQLKNDFEEPIFSQYPELERIKAKLYDDGAVYASMTGSGSAVYGIFAKDKPGIISFPQHYFTRVISLPASVNR